MKERIRVATAGTGYFSQFHYNAWTRMRDEGLIDFVALCNRSAGPAEAFARRFGVPGVYADVPSMLDHVEVDVLDVITPPATHVASVRAAIDRGCTVICQKPFTCSIQEAEALVDYIDGREARVFVHENFRFQPWYPKLKALMDEGAIGDPYQVTFRLRPGDGQGPEAYLNRQPYFQQMPRFLVHETAIHLVDTFRFLLGEVNSVYADLIRLNPIIAGEDAGVIIFGFDNGCRGLFDGNRLVDHPAENRRLTMGELTVEGSAGTLTLDGDGNIKLRAQGENNAKTVPYAWQNKEFAGDCVYATNRHVIEHLCKGTPVVNSAREYLANLRIEEAIYRSAETRRRISLSAS